MNSQKQSNSNETGKASLVRSSSRNFKYWSGLSFNNKFAWMFLCPRPRGAFWNSAIRPSVCPMTQLPRLKARWLPAALPPRATRDVRTADPSADGRRSAAISATVELPSAGGGHIVSPPPGRYLVIPAKAFARDYGITGVRLSVCLSVCYHDN